MKFEIEKIQHSGLIRFRGEIQRDELEAALSRMDNIERACVEDEQRSAADCLLDLEMIYRRHQEIVTGT